MSKEKELNLKISAQSFEIKNLEIKDGRLELVLSAIISDTNIEESTYDYEVKTNQYAEDIDIQDSASSEPLPVIALEEDPRYGEPEEDIEWQAVNSDDNDDEEVSEIILEDEVIYPSEDNANNNNEVEPQITLEDTERYREEVEENLQQPTSVGSEQNIHNHSQPNTTIDMDDDIEELPDYLKPSTVIHKQNITEEPTPTSEQSKLTRTRSEDYPTEAFPRVKPSKVFADQPTKEMNLTESNTQDQASATNKTKEQSCDHENNSIKSHQHEKRKVVRFCCPRCKTQGSQDISSIGSIISCSNCGRALKLNVKK